MWSKPSTRDKPSDQSPAPAVMPEETPSAPIAAPPKAEPPGRIGRTIVVRGELSGEEDLIIEGRVEGRISLEGHHLTVGESGHIAAEVMAKTVTIIGRMEGNLHAKDRAEISESGSLTGDIQSPRVIIADGANFKGSVDMTSVDTVQAAAPQPVKRKDAESPQNRRTEGAAAQKE
ncbi:MAG: polymer-forming cytoskeletal protein [Nitrospinota bacterium]